MRESTDIFLLLRGYFVISRGSKMSKKKFEVNFKRLLMSVLLWIASTHRQHARSLRLERAVETSCAKMKLLGLLPVATTKQYSKFPLSDNDFNKSASLSTSPL